MQDARDLEGTMTRQSVLATGPEASDWWCFGSGDEPARESFSAGGRSLAASRKPAAAPGLRTFDLLPGNPPKNP
ncbi:hypothetical protein VNPA142037_54940 [Pseudomonas aeruginosa]|nr:hypothetical protein CSB96_4197 [Pseudomonas aeruginosa]GLF04288.1 hypothetical protein VNPA120889_44430 [Pseudomonas aeruginosa]GLF24123.1 hypothetical protein VNPA131463_49600 [Pseudomonas aeruginosa]GLF46615.1 hypothetical protein VNPA141752_32710 [Pseudomonas aeruginosa]GLF67697.1 hypothetical protein VNPA142037_54940 [Pseudomonas aeruginosa]